MKIARVVIREASRADIDAIWALVSLFDGVSPRDRERVELAYDGIHAEPGTLLLVAATDDADAVGYLLATRRTTLLPGGTTVLIEELMVREELRRHGVGRALVVAAKQWARQAQARSIALATGRAGQFYLALGYGRTADYYKKALTK